MRHVAGGPLPPGLASVVDAALAADPAARPSAADVHRHLVAPPETSTEFAPTEIRPGRGTEVMPVPRQDVTRPWRRNVWPIIAVAVLVVLLALALGRGGSGANRGTASTPSVAPVPTANDPSQTARDLADWLRAQAR